MENLPLLEITDLCATFHSEGEPNQVLDRVNLTIYPGETVALAGESGSGKSVTALSILRLLDREAATITGRIEFAGQDLAALTEDEMRKVRGNRIAMIFQEPMTSLNPVYTVGSQIIESLTIHQGLSESEARRRAIELLARTGIPDPDQRIDAFAHQLSGGQRQRVMIAMALACRPALLIADEPTTALDVTIQAQILNLIKESPAGDGHGGAADHPRSEHGQKDRPPGKHHAPGADCRIRPHREHLQRSPGSLHHPPLEQRSRMAARSPSRSHRRSWRSATSSAISRSRRVSSGARWG